MKVAKVSVVKAIKIDGGPYRTKTYRSAHAAAEDYAAKSTGEWYIKLSPAQQQACQHTGSYRTRFEKVARRVKPIFAALLK